MGTQSTTAKAKCVDTAKYPVSPRTKDTFGGFFTHTLATIVWLHTKGCEVTSTRCAWCPGDHDVRHIFVNCQHALCLWFDIEKCVGHRLNVSWGTLKFLQKSAGFSGQTKEILLLTGLQAIWESRREKVNMEPKRRNHMDIFSSRLRWTLSVLENNPQRQQELEFLRRCLHDPWRIQH